MTKNWVQCEPILVKKKQVIQTCNSRKTFFQKLFIKTKSIRIVLILVSTTNIALIEAGKSRFYLRISAFIFIAC